MSLPNRLPDRGPLIRLAKLSFRVIVCSRSPSAGSRTGDEDLWKLGFLYAGDPRFVLIGDRLRGMARGRLVLPLRSVRGPGPAPASVRMRNENVKLILQMNHAGNQLRRQRSYLMRYPCLHFLLHRLCHHYLRSQRLSHSVSVAKRRHRPLVACPVRPHLRDEAGKDQFSCSNG